MIRGENIANKTPGSSPARGRERIGPGAALINMNSDTTKIKKIADLPMDERQRLLEAAAEHAASDYESDKELVAFTDLDGAVND